MSLFRRPTLTSRRSRPHTCWSLARDTSLWRKRKPNESRTEPQVAWRPQKNSDWRGFCWQSSRASFEAERGEAIYSFLAVAALLGRDAGTVRIQDGYPEAAPLPDFETIAGISSVQHPKVRMQEAGIREAQANVELQRSRLLPSVTAGSYDFQYRGLSWGHSKSVGIGPIGTRPHF